MLEQDPIQEQETKHNLLDRIKLVLWKDTQWNNLFMKFSNNGFVSWIKAFFKLFQATNAIPIWNVEGQNAQLDNFDKSIQDGVGEIVLTSVSWSLSVLNSFSYWQKLRKAKKDQEEGYDELKKVLDQRIMSFECRDNKDAADFLVTNLFGGEKELKEIYEKLTGAVRNILQKEGKLERINAILQTWPNKTIQEQNVAKNELYAILFTETEIFARFAIRKTILSTIAAKADQYSLFKYVCDLKQQEGLGCFDIYGCIKELFSKKESYKISKLLEWTNFTKEPSFNNLVTLFEILLSNKIVTQLRYDAIIAELKKKLDFKAIDETLVAISNVNRVQQLTSEDAAEKLEFFERKNYDIGIYLNISPIVDAEETVDKGLTEQQKNNLIFLLGLCENSKLSDVQKYFLKQIIPKRIKDNKKLSGKFCELLSKEHLDITEFVTIINEIFLSTRATIDFDIKRDIKNKRVCNFKAYFASTIGYTGRSIGFVIKTAFSHGDQGKSFADFFFGNGEHTWWRGPFLAAQLINIIFSLVSSIINAYTSILNYGRALDELKAKKEWSDYPVHMKVARAIGLFFTYGTAGELCGGVAGILSGCVYTVLSVVGVIIGVSFPIPTLCVSIFSLAFSALYYTSYMSINIERDYKKTQGAAYTGMIVQGVLMLSSGMLTGILIVVAKVLGVACLSFLAAATPGGIAVAVGCILLGTMVLGASLYIRHRKQKAEAKLKLEGEAELKGEPEKISITEPEKISITEQKEPTRGLLEVIAEWWRGDSGDNVLSIPARASDTVNVDDAVLRRVETDGSSSAIFSVFNRFRRVLPGNTGKAVVSQQSNRSSQQPVQLPPSPAGSPPGPSSPQSITQSLQSSPRQ